MLASKKRVEEVREALVERVCKMYDYFDVYREELREDINVVRKQQGAARDAINRHAQRLSHMEFVIGRLNRTVDAQALTIQLLLDKLNLKQGEIPALKPIPYLTEKE